jgi:DNA-binding NarL/FixJ family response regulator
MLASAIQESTSPAQLAAYLRATEQADVTELLLGVAAPALVIHFSDITVGSHDLARDVASRLPHARFLVTETRVASTAVNAFLTGSSESTPGTPNARSIASLGLSRRQSEVLQLISHGRTNREIADELVLSLRTVERHVADLYKRLGVRNRAEAVAIGVAFDATV